MRLATGPATPDKALTVVSAFVEGCATKAAAQRAAKAELITRGRTPDYPVHADDLGDGSWEVLFTQRPLREGQGYLPSGQRVGTTIAG